MEKQPFLILFVSDGDDSSISAAEQVKARLGEGCRLQVIDIDEDPDLAEVTGVDTTPTLIRLSPDPRRRVVGDLSDAAEVARYLGSDWHPEQAV